MLRQAVLAAAIAISVSPLTLAGQDLPRAWISLASAVGASRGDGTVYQGSPFLGGRVGAGLAVAGRLGFEVSGEMIRGFGRGDYACVGGVPCPAYFDLTGASGSLVFHAGPAHDASRLRVSAGAGAYRLTNDFPYPSGLATTVALGLHADAEVRVVRSGFTDLAIGIRPVAVIDANAAIVWVVPLTVTLRLAR